MKCKNCGAELKIGDKFCTECGTKVETTRICPKCGKETTGRYCIDCGYDLDTNPMPQTSAPPTFGQPNYSGVYTDVTPKKNRSLILVVVGLALAIVLGMVVTASFITKKNVPSQVIKEEKRLEKKEEKDDKDFDTDSYQEDVMLMNGLSSKKSLKDLEDLTKKVGTLNSDDEYEIEGVIDGREVTYYVTFDGEFEVMTAYMAEDEKDYKEFKQYLKNYFEKNYEHDPYELEESDDEFIYEDENDFIMMMTDDDEYYVFVYRSKAYEQ